MNSLNLRKNLLLVVIAATAAGPLVLVRPDEAGLGLSAVKYLAKVGSLSGVILMFWQVLLGFRGMLAKLIPDYIWVIGVHKAIGTYLLPLILLHPGFITLYYLMAFDRNVLLLEGPVSFQWYVLCGVFALAVIAVVVLTSVFLRDTLSKRTWYIIHLSSYAVLPVVFVHSFPIGMTVNGTALRAIWVCLVFVLSGMYVF